MAAKALTQKEFLDKCHKVHGNKYSYEKSVYAGSKRTLTITCRIHGDFEQIANKHLLGCGCTECGRAEHSVRMSKPKKDASDFLRQLKSIYGRRYDYSDAQFAGMAKSVNLTCKRHGSFSQKASALLKGHGCQKCGYGVPSLKEFIRAARKVHGRQYDYSKVEFNKLADRVILTCRHGQSTISVRQHLLGQGCKQCGFDRHAEDRVRVKAESFVARAKEVHGDRYDYSASDYKGRHREIRIVCKTHGEFFMQAGNHLNGQNCPHCANSGYSQMAVDWIEQEAKRRRLKDVWHALNGGEFLIPGTRYAADGYHAKSNTIFEFYGDAFHGNPKVYKSTDTPHPFRRHKTAKELYLATVRKEQTLLALGYNLVTKWESDYRKGRK